MNLFETEILRLVQGFDIPPRLVEVQAKYGEVHDTDPPSYDQTLAVTRGLVELRYVKIIPTEDGMRMQITELGETFLRRQQRGKYPNLPWVILGAATALLSAFVSWAYFQGAL